MENSFEHMETLKKITEKAHDLFFRYGIRSVTMDDIARDLGMSKKTIYMFFGNKEALVEELVDIEITKNTVSCQMLVSISDDAIIELFFLLVYAKRLYLKLNSSIIYDLEKNHRDIYIKLNDYKNGFIYQSIKTSILKGINHYLYQPELNVEIIVRFFLNSLVIVTDNKIFPADRFNSNIVAEGIFRQLISGIASSAGIELINKYKNQQGLISLIDPGSKPYWDA
jgi:TetR/AcrR family transcriptional regulator, cholesterol catabolism regulator